VAQPDIDNRTPFLAETLFLANEQGRSLLVPVIKATFVMADGQLLFCEEQAPVNTVGEFWGEPRSSSFKYEPECAFIKVATDVALIGHAHAPSSRATDVDVSLQVGPLQKTVRVFGDRTWFKSLGRVLMTRPLPFERIPLRYERAFGGWDRSHADPQQHRFDSRNPVGAGFRASNRNFEEDLPLPNLEDPEEPLIRFGQAGRPVGFGFICPEWQPRASLAGTYDETWRKTRMPWLPTNFDRRFFNAAPPGLVAPGYLRGDEAVLLLHGTPEGILTFKLPGVRPPNVLLERTRRTDERVSMALDTVILNVDERCVFLLWRGQTMLADGPREVRTVVIDSEQDLDPLMDSAVPLPEQP
jgi:hypothetical protein